MSDDNFPSKLLQALSSPLSSSLGSHHGHTANALEECNRSFEADSPSALSTSTTPSNSLLIQVARELESKLRKDISNDTKKTNGEAVVVFVDHEYSEYLRAAKNLLRWNLIWQSQHPNRTIPTAVSTFDEDHDDTNANRNPLETLQRFGMLRVYMSHLNASIGIESRQNEARYATLCLLHATYHKMHCQDDATQGEEEQQSPLDYLVQDLSYIRIFCKVMLNGATSRLVQLANLRLLHNLLVSLPSLVKDLSQYTVIDSNDEDKNNLIPLTSMSTVQDLLLFHIDVYSREKASGDENKNDDDDGRELEVITELMRILYILRAGKIMDPRVLKRLVLRPESRLLAIMLLTDTPTVTVMEMEVQSILLDTLEVQVSIVLDQTLLGSESASSVTPILMLIHNLCKNHMDFRTTTRHYIFPNPVTLSSSAAKPSLAVTTKMSPADAPRGSLRYKCIRLLTWTESHTKRWMAELLWMLCDANAEEYTYRVGMGNAMPLLHARGLVELPTVAASTNAYHVDNANYR